MLRVPGDFSVISNAIAAAAPGDTVRVAGNGGSTYRERFIIDKALTLEGGWRRDFQVRDPSIYISVIREDAFDRSIVRVDTSDPVFISGFTIIGGRSGIEATNSNATIRDCEIRGQRNFLGSDPALNRVGGALRVAGGNVVIERVFAHDVVSSFSGSGLAVVNVQSVTVTDCQFDNLLSAHLGLDTSGGGIFANGAGTLRLERTTVSRSGTGIDAGLVLAQNIRFEAIDCTFFQGSASVNSGGLKFVSCPSVELSGCTIEENQAIRLGGGVFVQDCPSFTMSDCDLRNNVARDEGGALRMLNTTFTLNDNHFENNYRETTPIFVAIRGGAVGTLNSSGTVNRCCFANERSNGWGGAWAQVGGEIEFSDCSFDNTEAKQFGGAYQIQLSGRARFQRSLFHGNRAKFGGAVAASFTGRVEFRRCTFAEGEAATGGAAVYLDTDARANVESSILCCAVRGNLVHCEGGTLELTHTNTWNDDATNSRQEFSGCPNPAGTNGNLELDPLFCPVVSPPPFCDASLPAFTLRPGSPCAGSGLGGVDMGWKGIGCSSSPPLNLQEETWGKVKAKYRTP